VFKLLDWLFKSFATFYLNNCSILRIVGDYSFINKDRNFRKRVKLSINSKFIISFKQGDFEPCNINGSLYLIERLIIASERSRQILNYIKKKGSAFNSVLYTKTIGQKYNSYSEINKL